MSAALQEPAESPPEAGGRRPTGRPRKNWTEAKHLFVHGMVDTQGQHQWFTLEEIGDRFDIASIQRTAGKEKWTDERELYRQQLAQKRQEARTDLLAQKAAEFDAKALQVFDAIIQQVRVHLAQSARDKRPLHPSVLQKLSATARNAHVSGRLAMGDTTEITKQVGTVTHEFDLSNLSDEELAQLELLRGKMQGVQIADQVVH